MQTPEVRQTLDEIATAFREARGDAGDEQWARRAAARFALDDVADPPANRALAALVPVVVESQEPARELFGDPGEWATTQQATWRAEGVVATAPAGPTSLRGFVHDAFFGAATISAVLTPLRMLVDGWRYELTLALVLFPLLIAVLSLGLSLAWRALNRRRSRAVAVAGVAGLLVAVVWPIGAFLAWTYPVSFGERSGLWLLAVATGYGIVASVVGRRWPAPEAPGPADPAAPAESDEDWVRGVTAALRERDDLTAARVRSVVDEARSHVGETGRALHEEFGPSASYAVRFPPDQALRNRRAAWSWTVAAAAPVAFFLVMVGRDGWAWQTPFIGLAVLFAASLTRAVTSWRRARRAAQERDLERGAASGGAE